jgi:hypothetical protein
MMAANVENHSPEISGLLAANSGFALVEEAFIPVSLPVRPALLWFIAVISLGALTMAGGATVAGDVPPVAAIAELPAAAEVIPPVPAPAQSTAERPTSVKNPSVQPVVLRGQPMAMGRRS